MGDDLPSKKIHLHPTVLNDKRTLKKFLTKADKDGIFEEGKYIIDQCRQCTILTVRSGSNPKKEDYLNHCEECKKETTHKDRAVFEIHPREDRS